MTPRRAGCRAARRAAAAFLVALAILVPRRAGADDAQRATFALIIGSNASVDAELAPLKYADDDAARYLDLFRLLGARTYVLTRLDENTKRLHPQAAAEAMEPKRAQFESAVAQLTKDVAQASQRNVETVVYFVYAGHGNVQNGQGYITLEDMRITGPDLARVVGGIPAKQIHVIADACASYFLAYSRGPGGQRRAIEGLGAVGELTADARVGLLLSTSSARESHEWDAFQAGVFSHEVRSGLYGAADADGDGRVSYREIAAFVARASAAVPNERFRPDVHSRAPRSGDTLVDVRRARERRIDIDGKHAGRYYLEDARGVRLADVHNAPGQSLSLVRPPPTGPVFLRRLDEDAEYEIAAGPEIVAIADVAAAPPRTASRGAAHESFNLLFSLPFDRSVVDAYRDPHPPDAETFAQRSPEAPAPAPGPGGGDASSTRRAIALGALGIGALAVGAGVYWSVRAHDVRGDVGSETSQIGAADAARRIERLNESATISYVVGGAGVLTGAALLLWPSLPRGAKNVRAGPWADGAFVGYGGSL